MRLLLDTHTFLWWDTKSTKLSPKVLALLQDRSNTLLLSLASVWELQIKAQIGKLNLVAPLSEILEKQRQANRIQLFPITLDHILALGSLPDHHRDPFDRLLVAQATVENLPVLTNDAMIAKYPIQIMW